jgi:hypothetical protein
LTGERREVTGKEGRKEVRMGTRWGEVAGVLLYEELDLL